MKLRKSLFLFLLSVISLPVWAVVTEVPISDLYPHRSHRQSTIVITDVISKYHYRDIALDDALSSQMLERYLDTLDPNRSFFIAEDVNAFSDYDKKLDDALRQARLDPAFDIFRTYRKRVNQQVKLALRLLDEKFDFSKDEEYRFDRSEAPWAANQNELDALWRKRVKNDVLSLRMADKDDEAIHKTLSERYSGILRRTNQLNADDVFQIFINAYTLSLEPHTSYMSPSVSENFDISMRLSLEGIGAVLRVKSEYTVVQSIVPGGPADLNGQITAGDRISGVAQDDEDMVDVVGWRLQDVVELIRGPKGSVVRLQVLPKDAAVGDPSKTITIVRNKIKLEEQAAKKSIIEGLEGMGKRRIGVIDVPTFYRDFRAYAKGDKDFRSTTRDVRKLLAELISEGVDGVVMDLRQNGGGSLAEATELTGLFIKSGPVVQVKDTLGKVEVESDPDPKIAYSGPLAVLVNRNSASASEIFAGAIQDYGRGIIIGEPTFGKGTVQTLVDLDRLVAAGTEELGRLRLTMAQFFRISGGSTQFRGVVPDIVFPTASNADDHGERSLDNALPWAQIKAARFNAEDATDLTYLKERHLKRIGSDAGFRMLVEEERWIRAVREQHTVSLLEVQRRTKWNERDEKIRENRNRYRVAIGLKPRTKTDYSDEVDAPAGHEDDEKIDQIMVNEAAHILSDFIYLQQPRAAGLQLDEAEKMANSAQDCMLSAAGC